MTSVLGLTLAKGVVAQRPGSSFTRGLIMTKAAHGTQTGHWVTMHGTHVYIDGAGRPQYPHDAHSTHTPAALPPHIAALKIPPAWTDVRWNADPDADLLVVGKDAQGRTQRIYAARFAESQAAQKFRRIAALEAEADRLRDQNAAAQHASDARIRDSADCLALIMATGIRPGSDRETRAKVKAYGATTLEGRHVVTHEGHTTLEYVGKKGVALTIPITNAAVAQMVRQRAQQAGPNGKLFPATSDAALRQYTQTLDTGRFKPKDFRTLLATQTALAAMDRVPAPHDPKSYVKAVKAVATVVARQLGNTPTVALQSYIAPEIFADWRMASHV